MRDHKQKKDRKRSERQFDIDVVISGLGVVTGKTDRFRCSAETRDAKLAKQRRAMVEDMGRRLLFDVLAARLDGRFSTRALEVAYKQGDAELRKLAISSSQRLLAPLLSEWMVCYSGQSRSGYERQVSSFIEFYGGPQKASVADLTTDKIARWIDGLTDSRRGKAGSPRRSESKSAVENRVYRAKRDKDKPPRPLSAASRNRHRTALLAFCTFLVNKSSPALAVHPIRGGRLKGRPEAASRMPSMDSTTWTAYKEAMALDTAAPKESVLIAQILRHTGADVGEVLGYSPAPGKWASGMQARDIRVGSQLARIRFKRQKVASSPERLVPTPDDIVGGLMAHINAHSLSDDDAVFGMVDRRSFEAAHRRVRKAIGKPNLNLKDFRHLAAISWAQAGASLPRIKEWLGHSSIRQTEIYAKFAPDDVFDAPVVQRATEIAIGAPTSRLNTAA